VRGTRQVVVDRGGTIYVGKVYGSAGLAAAKKAG
jgi:hypothetical protein